MSDIVKLNRRDFVKLGALAAGGLTLGVYVPDPRPWVRESEPLQPNVFVRVDRDGTVTIWLNKSEMGQGVSTSLPMIVADELDADWTAVKVLQADAHPSKYGRQMTVGSWSVRGSWEQMRRAGAAGRTMLVAAAAARWGVDPESCRAESSRVLHDASGRSLAYGELAEDASTLPVPQEPRLKDPSQFRLIGKPMPLIDAPLKVTGEAVFGIDVRIPDMLFATVVHPPVFGGAVKSFDASGALQVPGVRDVVQVSQGVAVAAENTWAAFEGAKALDIVWDLGEFSMSSADISRSFRRLATSDGAVARNDGDCEIALQQATRHIEATYEVPYLAHATMEPMNCTADVRPDRCEIWAPTQNPQGAQRTAAGLTSIPVEDVSVHVTYLGCGFGRRSASDFVRDAVETSMKLGAPVQIVWTREEDMQHDFYRPATYNRFEAGLDANGRVTAWKHRIAGPSILQTAGRQPRGGLDFTSVDGAANMPYDVPNVFVDYCKSDVPVPVGWWRSVGPSQNTFITESFVDELAHAAGQDPFKFRRGLLSKEPRLRKVLEVAAEKSDWGSALPAQRARGIAIVEDKGGLVAQVAEVSLVDGHVRVHRATCVVDCGIVVNPDTVEAQMVGSIVYGLTAALYGEITIERGRVKQSNFDDYPMLRMDEMPEVDVHIVTSSESPGGVGEPGVPPIAPAVTNALFALTGVRIRRLPIKTQEISAAASG